MPHEVIMPALGMAQQTGLVIAWHKRVGDPVTAGEVLLEVETDKSAMDVEALHSGYVAAIGAAAGAEVPVGQVIALISDEPLDPDAEPAVITSPEGRKREATSLPSGPETQAAAVPATAQHAFSAAAAPILASSPPESSRILASPKAKRLAFERGIDLSQLVSAGMLQPLRAADVEHAPVRQATGQPAPLLVSHCNARAPTAGFLDLVSSFTREGLEVVPQSAMWTAFAAAALRAQTGAQSLCIRLVCVEPAFDGIYADPDRHSFSALRATEPGRGPDLIVFDLSGSRLKSVSPGALQCPVLSVSQNADDFEMTMAFDETRLTILQAMAVIEGFAGRLAQPLIHLV